MGSIKYYLFTRFFGVVFLQIIVLSVFTWRYFSEDFFQESIDESYVQLKTISKNVDYFYRHQIEEVRRITKGKGFVPFNEKVARETLNHYLDTRKLITSIHYFDEKGHLVFKAKGSQVPDYQSERHYTDHSDSNFISYFDKARYEKKVVFTPPLFTRSGVFYHVALIPVFKTDGLNLEGVLSIGFFPSLNPLGTTLSGLSLHSNNFFAITNERGLVIATTLDDKELLAKPMQKYIHHRGPTPENPYNYQRKLVDDLRYEVGGQKYYLISVQVADLPLFAVLGVSEHLLLKKRSKIMDIITILIGVSTLIGLFTTVVITGKISSGIQSLVTAIKELKAGTYEPKEDASLHQDFHDALKEIEDLSVEIEKGKLLGNLWGQEQLLRQDEKDGK